MRHGVVARGGVLLGEELIEARVGADFGGTRPALVETAGGALEIAYDRFVGWHRADGPEGVGMIRRAAVTWTVDQINAISLLREVVRPSRLAVALPQVMQHLRAAAVHQHDGIGMPDLLRRQILHEHLPGHDGAVGHFLFGRAHPKDAGVGQLQGRLAGLRGRDGSALLHVLADPVQYRLQHFAIILLHHHEVRVAADADLPQLDVIELEAGLAQKRDRAGIVRRVIGGLRRDQHGRNAKQIFELARGLLLNKVRIDAGFGGSHFHGLQLGRVLDGRIERHLAGRHAVLQIAEGRAGRLDADHCLDEIRAHVGRDPCVRAARRVRHDHGGPDLVEQFGEALTPDVVRGFQIGDE